MRFSSKQVQLKVAYALREHELAHQQAIASLHKHSRRLAVWTFVLVAFAYSAGVAAPLLVGAYNPPAISAAHEKVRAAGTYLSKKWDQARAWVRQR